MRSEARWNAAVAKHEAAVRDFLAACEKCPLDEWQRSADGKWSTAAVALHICNAYELGRDAMLRGASMQLVVSKRYAWFLRTFALPLIIATTRFPRAKAPREVRPNVEETKMLTRDAMRGRLLRASREASDAFRNAARHDFPAPHDPRLLRRPHTLQCFAATHSSHASSHAVSRLATRNS
jgi:hypothetical protein